MFVSNAVIVIIGAVILGVGLNFCCKNHCDSKGIRISPALYRTYHPDLILFAGICLYRVKIP